MEEKVLAKGEFAKNTIARGLSIVAICILGVSIIMGITSYYDASEHYLQSTSLIKHLTAYSIDLGNWFGVGYIAAIMLILIALYYWKKLSLCEITVSDKRVWGKTNFGKRVDLPLHQISAVAYGSFGGISVATSSGSIHFWYLKNRDELHTVISQLLVAQQDRNTAPVVMEKESSADDLKKFKELLDSGVITQEEFDAKKKQLLGV